VGLMHLYNLGGYPSQNSHNISAYLIFILRLRRYINASSLSFFRSSVSRCKIPPSPLLDRGLFFSPKYGKCQNGCPQLGNGAYFTIR